MKILTTLLSSVLVMTSVQTRAEDNFHYDFATVLQSKPIYRIVEVSANEQRCRNVEVIYQQPRRQSSKPSLVGGILGAAVGHALGHRSKHRTGATIAGAIVGASIGGDKKTVVNQNTRFEQRCDTVPTFREEERLIGYDVVYRYNGRTFETRLPFEPENSLKIRVIIAPIADSFSESE